MLGKDVLKYFYIFLVFILGVALGRWSAPRAQTALVSENTVAVTEPSSLEVEKKSQVTEESVRPQDAVSSNNLNRFARTDKNVKNKKMWNLFDQLVEAGKRGDVAEQNALLAEMERLDSKHERVFQVKAEILQDNEDWDGAHKVLEECVAAIPDSVFCLKRLSNIRSSTDDDKIRYGTECLRVSSNNQACMVDLAIALNSKGQFAAAKDYFERALNTVSGSLGYHKEYILFHYAVSLERLYMYEKAKDAYMESCRLGNSSACAKVKT